MHLVFLNQYYPPDAAPTGVMLEAVVEQLARDGHQVTVLCAAGGYAGREKLKSETLKAESRIETQESRCQTEREFHSSLPSSNQQSTINHQHLPSNSQPSTINSQLLPSSPQPSTINSQLLPTIHRLRASRFGRGTFIGKLLDYASYYGGVAWKLLTLRPAPERIVALTTPPFLSVLARLLSKIRGADHAHWVMDLYPDVMAAHGMLGEQTAGYRILTRLARWGFGGRRCAAVLTLGPDMAARVGRVMGTSNIEGGGIERAGRMPALLDSQPSTLNPQLSTVHWVPLWGDSGSAGVSPASSERSTGVSPVSSSSFPHEVEQDQEPAAGQDAPATVLSETLQPPKEGDEDIAAPYRSAASAALRLKRGWADDELIVMYSGNMGLGHRFGEILEAAVRIERVVGDPLSVVRADGGATTDVGSASCSQPSTLNHQRSSLNSSPRGMNESRDESRGPVRVTGDVGEGTSNIERQTSNIERAGRMPALLDSQLSTLNSQLSTIRFVFFGGGKRRVEVENFARDNPGAVVEVHDYAPADQLMAHLQSADVHFASLDTAWTGTMVPSKLQGIFAAGRPVIFIGSAESSIGRWVAESGGGWLVQAGDVTGLLAALDEARDPEIRRTRGRAAMAHAEKHFDRRTNVARVAAILGRVC